MNRDTSFQLDEISTQNSDAQLVPNSTSQNFNDVDENLQTGHCGYKRCHPKWLQRCADIRLFTAFLSLLSCLNGAVSASYLPSVITSIERRFELNSLTSGLVVASYEVGAVIAVIFVSYLGTQRHIPIIIGIGAILVGIGSCLFALPHFISPLYSLSLSETSNHTAQQVCPSYNATLLQLSETKMCEEKKLSVINEWCVFIFVVAQTFIGIGSTPILTLGLSYIDSHVSKKASPQYFGKLDQNDAGHLP